MAANDPPYTLHRAGDSDIGTLDIALARWGYV